MDLSSTPFLANSTMGQEGKGKGSAQYFGSFETFNNRAAFFRCILNGSNYSLGNGVVVGFDLHLDEWAEIEKAGYE